MIKTSTAVLGFALACLAAQPLQADGGGAKPASQPSEYSQAVSAIKKEDYAAAAELLEKLLEKDPDNADAWNQLGFSLRKMQQFDAALDAYEQALRIDPKHKGALEYLGELFLMTDQPELAKAQLEKLDDACFLSCKELRLLRKRIAEYEGGP